MKDFIIVGGGLAAHVLAQRFRMQNISFTMIANPGLSNCSRVAAGIWNPMVFKRAAKSWMADLLIEELISFYSNCEIHLGKKLITLRPIVKPFTEDQEKSLWEKKAGTDLFGFIDKQIHVTPPDDLEHCKIKNGYGIVKQAGNLDVETFMTESAISFKESLLIETFDHTRLQVFSNLVSYGGHQARHIVFCEGFLVKDNPLFKWIPLKPAKGEVMTLSVPDLHFKDKIFNKNGFIMDRPDGLYKAGATYEWHDLSPEPTEQGASELKGKINEMIDCRYQVIRHEAGIRPSSVDRRPIIGAHPKYKNCFVLNGLGTKGVMLAPYFTKNFVNFYLQKEVLNPDVDLSRFYHLYEA